MERAAIHRDRKALLRTFLIVIAIILIAVAVALMVDACLSNVKRSSWQLTDPPSGRALHLVVQLSGCDDFQRLTVKESEDAVLIEAYIRQNVRSSCPLILIYEPRTVELSDPVGSRVLQGCNPPSAIYKWPDVSDADCVSSIQSQ